MSRWLFATAALALWSPARAVVIGGEVRTVDGTPIAGAEVTASDTEQGVSVTVYGAEDGRFGLPPLAGSRYEVRARARGHAEQTTTLVVGAHDLFRTTTIVLEADSEAPGAIGRMAPSPVADVRTSVLTVWDVGDTGSVLHDVAMAAGDVAYAVDLSHDLLYRLDVRTGERRAFAIRAGPSPPHPVPAGARARPYAVAVAPDGAVWVTLAFANVLARFDAASEAFAIVPQAEGVRPQSLRVDARGRLWYTLAVSNHVGTYDPVTRAQHVYRLPARTWPRELAVRAVPLAQWLGRLADADPERAAEAARLPVPSGIDIAPDGSIWFAQLNDRRIGRLDPDTGAIRMIDTPFPAPRRPRVDSRGRLWVVSAPEGMLARFDPATEAFATWTLPATTEGAATPDALAVDARTDAVWIGGATIGALVRFTAEDERFTVYPLPDHVRDAQGVAVDEHGAVWTCSANPPALIRLEP